MDRTQSNETNDHDQAPRSHEGDFSFHDLTEATKNFSEKIGSGGFGVVYKGELPNGKVVAVKRLIKTFMDSHDLQQFRNEVESLKRLEHENIVRYIGYCFDVNKQERLLCCEYMTGGSLKDYLDSSRTFDWVKHYNILMGISSGLCYLHGPQQDGAIVHLDLKPDNILLSGDMEPKISDFGLSRIFGPEQTRHVTKNIIGTLGYMAPDYFEKNLISTKCDIFSFGILALVMLTGERPYPVNSIEMTQLYITKIRKNWSTMSKIKSRYGELNDDQLMEVIGCIAIGIECTEVNREARASAAILRSMLVNKSPLPDGLIFCFNECTRMQGYMLSAEALDIEHSNNTRHWLWRNIDSSRFKTKCACLLNVCWFYIKGEIPVKYLIMDTTYTVYLVYRLESNTSGLRGGQSTEIKLSSGSVLTSSRVCLDRGGRIDEPGVAYAEMRADGWMEIKLGEFPVHAGLLGGNKVEVVISETSDNIIKIGLVIEGMEFRPS